MRTSRRAFLATTCALPALAAAAATQPNIVVILCDDLGSGDVSAYNPEAKTRTPRMDALAREGVRFVDAHSPSGVCTPTRYGLMTGRYCWRTKLKQGVLQGYSPALIEPGRDTIASVLKRQGYRTGAFGKWHLGLGADAKADYSKELHPSPNDYGFDEFFGIPASLDMPPYLYIRNRQAVEQPTKTIEDRGAPPRGKFWRGGPIAPGFEMDQVLTRFTDSAVAFIKDSAQAKQPFFAYVPLSGPHTPWVPSKRFQGVGKEAGLYGDFVAEVDHCIGRILDQLAASKVAQDTLVIVTSDNGAPWSEPDIETAHGHRANMSWRGQKSDIQEGGHRIPFIVRWPGHTKANTTSNALLCLTDVFATCIAAAGATPVRESGEDSYNQVPAFEGRADLPIRPDIVHHSGNGLFSIRQGSWKLVLGRGSGGFTKPARIEPKPDEPAGELYDLKSDPHEDHNLYAAEPRRVAALTELLSKYQRQGFSRP
ncbi:MAG: arylsulfatase [Bryobacteraceae bacterium]|nr:arylsulfatase [Bryobacteraceae bacterium]